MRAVNAGVVTHTHTEEEEPGRKEGGRPAGCSCRQAVGVWLGMADGGRLRGVGSSSRRLA
jgi:hypothetical protein